MPKVIATKTTAVRRTKANEKRTTKLLTSGPTHSRHVASLPMYQIIERRLIVARAQF